MSDINYPPLMHDEAECVLIRSFLNDPKNSDVLRARAEDFVEAVIFRDQTLLNMTEEENQSMTPETTESFVKFADELRTIHFRNYVEKNITPDPLKGTDTECFICEIGKARTRTAWINQITSRDFLEMYIDSERGIPFHFAVHKIYDLKFDMFYERIFHNTDTFLDPTSREGREVERITQELNESREIFEIIMNEIYIHFQKPKDVDETRSRVRIKVEINKRSVLYAATAKLATMYMLNLTAEEIVQITVKAIKLLNRHKLVTDDTLNEIISSEFKDDSLATGEEPARQGLNNYLSFVIAKKAAGLT